jgi:hypothetical protein
MRFRSDRRRRIHAFGERIFIRAVQGKKCAGSLLDRVIDALLAFRRERSRF